MSRVRSYTKNSIHVHLSRTTASYKESSTYGKYGLKHGVYHLAVIGDGDKMWKLSRLEEWYYQQFKETMNIVMVFYNHQLMLSYFVAQHGKDRTDDLRLCALIAQSERLQNNSQTWLKMAIVEYRNGEISVEDILQVMTYLPTKRWFECVEILISIEIDLQTEEQNGRLSQVRTILQALLQHSEQCEAYVPLQRIGWYAKRICTLWNSITIQELLSPNQIESLSKNHDYLQWLKDSNQISKQQYIHSYLQNASILDAVTWIFEQSMESVQDILAEVRLQILFHIEHSRLDEHLVYLKRLVVEKDRLEESLSTVDDSKLRIIEDRLLVIEKELHFAQIVAKRIGSADPVRHSPKSPAAVYSNMSGLIRRWIVLSAGMSQLEKDGISVPDVIWDAWLKGIQSYKPSKVWSEISKLHRQSDTTPTQKIRKRELWKQKRESSNGLRIFSEMPVGLLKWLEKHIQSIGQPESIDRALTKHLRKVLQQRQEATPSFSTLVELDESEDFELTFSAWIEHVKNHGIEEKEYSKIIPIIQKKSLSIQQQDQILDVLLPMVETHLQPQKDVFCYLYLSLDNHSPKHQARLAKYLDRYLDISKFTANNKNEMSSLVHVFKHLIEYLSKNEKWAQSKKVDAYIREIIDHESMELFRTRLANSMILTPLKWGAWETACRRVEQSNVPYGKVEQMSNQINKDSEQIVVYMLQDETVWCHLTQVLQWRFFFEHPKVIQMSQLEGLSVMLSRLAKEGLLHIVSKAAEYLLEVFADMSLTDRVPACKSISPILRMVQKQELPAFTTSPCTPTIEKRIIHLIEDAYKFKSDLLRKAMLISMVKLSRFFDVSLEPQLKLPEESKVKKDISTDPAVVRHYREDELTKAEMDELYQRSKSDFIPFVHFKRMIDVVEDERQPAMLRSEIRKHVCEGVMHWVLSLRKNGTSEDLKGSLKIYEMLVQWMEREHIVSTLEELIEHWQGWCVDLPYSVVLESYVVHTTLDNNVRFIPEAMRFDVRTQFIHADAFVFDILAVHKEVTNLELLSSIDVYFFMLNQYQTDEEVFQICLDWLLNHSKQMMDGVWTHERVVILARKAEVFLAMKNHLVEQKRYTEIACFISNLPAPNIELRSLMEQKILGSTDQILSVYNELVYTETTKVSTFNAVFEHIYGQFLDLTTVSKIQRMLTDRYLRIETAERIVKRVLLKDPSILAESKDLIAMNLIDRAEVFDELFKMCMQQSNPVLHLQQYIHNGLFELQMVSNAFKQKIDNISVEALRKFALVEPANQTLHRDLLLSILITYAKNDDSVMVTQILDACPELFNASK